MGEVFFHARLVLTVCVSSSPLHHYVTWAVFFFPSLSWLVFPSLWQLFKSYINNLYTFSIITVK